MNKPKREVVKLHLLKSKIEQVYGTQVAFAEIVGQTQVNLNNKVLGKVPILPNQTVLYCKLLGIKSEEVGKYFFPQIPSIEDETDILADKLDLDY